MSSCVCSENDIGSAPNLSWSASARALSAVKLPVMLAWPSVMAALVCGAEMTWSSRTIANWFCGGCRPTRRVVTSPNSLVPLPLKDSRIS